jgi:hypothetical protein
VVARRLGVTALAVLGLRALRDSGHVPLLDAVNLAVHETGHLVFAPFGEVVGVLGGTVGQLLMPLLFLGYFLRRDDRFAAAIVGGWVAQNLWTISIYVADARAQALPLVGGGVHDWGYLLGRAGWLPHDVAFARGIHAAGVLLFFGSMATAWSHAAGPDRGAFGRAEAIPALPSASR